jgi:type IV pilus assembly protein PilC
MIYPMVVLGAAFGIVLGLMKFVIPKFISVLQDMLEGGKMHPITKAVLGTSEWIAFQYGWAVVLGVPFGIWLLIKILRKFKPCRFVLDAITLKLPIVGNLVNRVSITRWTRTLGTLIGAGVPILDAINVTRETAGNEVFTNLLTKVHNSIRQGDTFAGPLRQSRTVDGIVTNMIAVGEETGDLDKMLMKIADNFDEQVDVLVAGLMSMLEPVMILVLGSVVMVIVLAIFLPMIQIISGLGGSTGK